MKSTGECLGIAKTFNEALYKAFEGAGIKLPKHKNMIITVRDEDEGRDGGYRQKIPECGLPAFSPPKALRRVLNEQWSEGIRGSQDSSRSLQTCLDLILGHEIDLVIDIPQQGAERSHDGFVIRRNAIETGVNVLTALDTAAALATSLENRAKELSLIDIATVQ